MHWLPAILTVAGAYLIGAIPFGYLIARARGVDIFKQGSGNIGATNVGRVLGHQFGVVVFFLDFAKGAIPVALAIWLKPNYHDDLWKDGYVEVAAGLAAFLGHLFPIYLRFQGGKGVATGAGAVFVLLPVPMLVAMAVWSVVMVTTRYMSLASLAAVVVLCAVHLRWPSSWNWQEPRTWFCIVAGIMVFVRHHANMARLRSGTENQVKENLVMNQLCKSLHVTALGLWFGMSVFFTFVVALSLFGAMEAQGEEAQRESWFPRTPMYSGKADDVNPSKEQGTRAAGYAIGPIFVWYFALQGVCGFASLATALALMKSDGRVNRWRVNLLLAAVVLVLIGWPLERKVHGLREPRNEMTEAYLRDRTDQSKHKLMVEARGEFGQWHLYSVFVNLATVACVAGAMGMAGNLGSTKEEATPAKA